MNIYMLSGHCENGAFHALMDICFEYSDYFTLGFDDNSFCSSNHYSLEAELAPYLLCTQKVDLWYCYTPAFNVLHVFKAIPETQKIIDKYCNSIYFDEIDNQCGRQQFKYCDLCFFREDQLFLGTISHEHMAYIYSPFEDIWIDLLNAGHWIEPYYPSPSQLRLSNFIRP